MRISAVFESWHIADGNYPPLHRGQHVNLSFEMESDVLPSLTSEPSLMNDGGAQYRFVGIVLRVYNDDGSDAITVIEVAGFRFYINRSFGFRVGDWVQGSGKLLLDHYIWVEFLDKYKDPPDLFYQLRVERIYTVKIPEPFITRHSGGKSLPCSLTPSDYDASDLREIETMEGQASDEEFYLLELTDEGLVDPVPRTFI